MQDDRRELDRDRMRELRRGDSARVGLPRQYDWLRHDVPGR